MVFKRILFIICLGVVLLFFNGCNVNTSENKIDDLKNESNSNDYYDIINNIESYYDASYDMWMNLEYEDLSKYLDMESIQSQNKAVAYKENIEGWRYSIEKYIFKDIRERHRISFKYNSIEIINDTATVKVNLSGETTGMPAYPFFVSLGENTFILKKLDNNWLIHEHVYYDDVFFYERSKTEKIKLGFERVRQNVDRSYK